MPTSTEGEAFTNISAHTAAFALNGGKYGIDATATFGGGSVKFQKLLGDGQHRDGFHRRRLCGDRPAAGPVSVHDRHRDGDFRRGDARPVLTKRDFVLSCALILDDVFIGMDWRFEWLNPLPCFVALTSMPNRILGRQTARRPERQR
ncbi:hypothetical protein [Bradyrhizobium brasilense]|uniref:hypothetical protein n=1 Tax=Bradyrhizobium brasilense TaxID=1419277 RepID=UPI001300ECCB|nr:hypothetical protein [Bradyrhizobium brasilense]